MTVIGQQLISFVRAHAAQNPDFVYNSPLPRWPDGMEAPCVYVYDGAGSCLLGNALLDADIIDATFDKISMNKSHFRDVVDALGLSLDADEMSWLTEVQHQQDRKRPWGIAVIKADAALLENRPLSWAVVA